MPNTETQLRIISGEFTIIMLTLISMGVGAVWWASTLDGRVISLERERDLGKRNTLGDGMKRDARLDELTRMITVVTASDRRFETKLDKIAEDVAMLRGAVNNQ